jgi:hypothetical protein
MVLLRRWRSAAGAGQLGASADAAALKTEARTSSSGEDGVVACR